MLYDVPVRMNRYPLLCEYIHSMVAGCRDWIHSGELEKLCVVVLSKDGKTLEVLVIETKWIVASASTAASADTSRSDSVSSTAQNDSETSQALPLRQIEDAFRTALVALIAAPHTTRRSELAQPTSFRILVHTTEDVARPTTALNASSAANSWVLADPFWSDSSSSSAQLTPIKSIQRDALPFTFQLYVQTQ